MADPASTATDPEAPPSEPLEQLVKTRKRQKQRLVAGTIGAFVLLGGVAFGVLRYKDAQKKREVASTWGAFSRCMLGGELLHRERASVRLRAIQLTAMTMSDAERVLRGSDQPWPMSCAPLGHAVREALHGAAMEGGGKQNLAHSIENLAKLLGEPTSFMADLSQAADATWDQAMGESIPTASGALGPSSPMPASPLNASFLGSVEPLSRVSFALKAVYTDAHAGKTLRLLVDERSAPKAPFLCTFEGASAEATCAPLPSSIAKDSHGLRLLGTADDDAAPLVFAGNHGDGGVFRVDTGERVDALYSYGGYAKSDGSAAVLGWNEAKKELVLARKAKGKPLERTSIKPSFRVGNYYYSSQILWDELLLRGVTKAEERRLFAQAYRWEGAPLGDFTDIGGLEEPGLVSGGADEPPHIAGCRTDAMKVVRVKGYDIDFMTFRPKGGAWGSPVSPEITGGTLSCHGAEAVVTRIEPAGNDRAYKTSVTQSRCSTSGCRTEVVKMEPMLKGRLEFAPREGHVDAVDLNGKLLIVWAAGERGGVRMRLAPADQIGRAPDVVLFDDLVKDGEVQKLSGLLDLRLFSREGFAVLLLSTVSGVHALRIDDGGKVTPVKVRWRS